MFYFTEFPSFHNKRNSDENTEKIKRFSNFIGQRKCDSPQEDPLPMDNIQTGAVNIHSLLKHYRELSYTRTYKHETRYYCVGAALILDGPLLQTDIGVQNRAHKAEVRIMEILMVQIKWLPLRTLVR
jgi:hypothetical protein